jgi:hypothetical protein
MEIDEMDLVEELLRYIAERRFPEQGYHWGSDISAG